MENDSTINWAEITNNLFHEVSDGFMFLIDKVQEAMPYAWEIAQKQVWADAITDMIMSVACLVLALGVLKVGRKIHTDYQATKEYSEGKEFAFLTCYIGGGLASVVALVFTLVSINILIKVIINPDYYTILKLIEMSGLK